MLTNTELKKLSLHELIGYTNSLAIKLYDRLIDDGLLHKLSKDDEYTVEVWAEGLREEFIVNRIEGKCSLQAILDFDMDVCITNTIKDYNTMRKLVKKFKFI